MSETTWKCLKCGGKGIVGKANPTHGASVVCEKCGKFICWAGKTKINYSKAIYDTAKFFEKHADKEYNSEQILKVINAMLKKNTIE